MIYIVYNWCPVGEHMNESELKLYLQRLDLSEESVAIYLDLVEHSGGTPLSISRRIGINRTKVYRVVDEMARDKLVTIEISNNSTRISPAPISLIEEILRSKQAEVAELSKNWSRVHEQLSQIGVAKQAETKVKYYKGKTGIEQMVWNVLSAKSEVVGYTFRDLSQYVGEKFIDHFAEEFKRRNISMRDIYGDEYLNSSPIDTNWGERMNSKYIPSKVLAIPHQMDIYDNVVTFYSWHEGEVWGTEIYNEKVAQMQKQLFELAWEKARKI